MAGSNACFWTSQGSQICPEIPERKHQLLMRSEWTTLLGGPRHVPMILDLSPNCVYIYIYATHIVILHSKCRFDGEKSGRNVEQEVNQPMPISAQTEKMTYNTTNRLCWKTALHWKVQFIQSLSWEDAVAPANSRGTIAPVEKVEILVPAIVRLAGRAKSSWNLHLLRVAAQDVLGVARENCAQFHPVSFKCVLKSLYININNLKQRMKEYPTIDQI